MMYNSLPNGTVESAAKGAWQPNGYKHFVHITNEDKFFRSYKKWKVHHQRISPLFVLHGKVMNGKAAYNDIATVKKERAALLAQERRMANKRRKTNSNKKKKTIKKKTIKKKKPTKRRTIKSVKA